ncbi:hypothetical protein [Sporomusa sphaeroides]|uniref:Uncharacterized protein n=1 Tax=Sporomusa sphaeroides DSM 2875 TaxID=1337886 RepID=A0ABM9W013_9FIRM|nr:hypothetical protein [Sporomusa sphaeroides]OLS56414.1 hypothetical protein SPSPH_28070 [Sporomusa sphaeroides DSM 2875]CVK18509.1 hypothetical protein SSPH_01147 [Sporomusa sphaeroides DSM 2875]
MRSKKLSTLMIYEILQDHGAVTIEQGIPILMKYEPKPDPVELERKYWADKFRRVMRKKRDSAGIRDAFSDEHGTYHNVPTTKDRIALREINLQIDVKRDGLIKASKKIQLRQAELAGQIALQFESTAVNKE